MTNDTSTFGATAGERLLSLGEAARNLSLSLRSIQKIVASRLIPVVRIGRRVAVHPDDLRRFVAERRTSRDVPASS
jgi:excisionase family DNA binding protein